MIKNYKAKGISLIEVLVASTVMIIVFSLAINIYMNVKNQYSSHKEDTDEDIKQLYTKRVIYNFVKNAGIACRFGDKNQTYYDRTGDSLEGYFSNSSSVIIGSLPFSSGSSFSASLESGCSGECYQAGTDFIMVKKENTKTSLVANNDASTTLVVGSVSDITANDYLALCNKDYINILKASGINNTTDVITLSQAPSGSVYYSGDYLGTYSLEVLYIRDTGDTDDDGNEIYSLYVYIKNSSAQGMSYELIRGVKDLQLEYPTVSNGNITWHAISSDIGVDSLSYPALKAKFTVNNESFSKIVIL